MRRVQERDGNGRTGWLSMAPRVEELILESGIAVPGWHAEPETHRRFRDQVAKLLVEARLVNLGWACCRSTSPDPAWKRSSCATARS
jgi:hypothetical protein